MPSRFTRESLPATITAISCGFHGISSSIQLPVPVALLLGNGAESNGRANGSCFSELPLQMPVVKIHSDQQHKSQATDLNLQSFSHLIES